MPRTATAKPRGKPFAKGNAGKPKGARHKATLAAEALLEGEAEGLTRKAIEAALGGDMGALKLCLDRLVPPRRDRPVTFDLPAVKSASDHPDALGTILSAVATGDLTPSEAQAFAGILKEHRAAIETAELSDRLAALEERLSNGK